eukprot:scaffold23618_cov23-Cyclotella_meneghiniana.AAC.1
MPTLKEIEVTVLGSDEPLEIQQPSASQEPVSESPDDPSPSAIPETSDEQPKPKRHKPNKTGDTRPVPPLPILEDRPTKPQVSTHPDWKSVSCKPRLVDNESGDLEWVYWFWCNKKTHASSWFPPPPIGLLSEESDVEDTEEDQSTPQKKGGLMSFVVRQPPAESFALEESGELTVEKEAATEEENTVKPDEPLVFYGPPSMYDITFTGDLPVFLPMRPNAANASLSFPQKAREIGVNPNGLTRQQLTKAVRQRFIHHYHHGDDKSYLQSNCFAAKRQDIDRDRAETSAKKRKRETFEKAKEAGELKDDTKRVHHKTLCPETVIAQHGHRGIYRSLEGNRCGCNNVCVEHMDKDKLLRHFNSKCHTRWEAEREEEALRQSMLLGYNEQVELDEDERMKLKGTRKGSKTPSDIAFEKKTVKMCLSTGIPMNKLKRNFRRFLQEEGKKKIGPPQDLSAEYIPILLQEEIVLQREELRDATISLVYDETPRQGALLCNVARKIEKNLDLKKVKAIHRLIH